MALVSSSPSAVWRFGSFEFNRDTGELKKAGAEVKLPLQPARVLALLVERAGQLVTRDEIRREVWGEETFVDFEDGLNFCLNRIRAALGDDARSPRYIETFPRRGYRFVAPIEPVPATLPTLAVLPFDNLTHDPEQDYFGDAVTDALITELGNIGALRVISRQSVLHLKGSQRTVPEIARELEVDAIVEGSVLQAAHRIRITAQLIQAEPEQHLWARGYECELGDLLTTQGQIAKAIAEAIQVALTPGEMGRLCRPRPVDPDAHLAYLKGRHHMGRWTRESFRKALEYFQLALEKDSGHALAHAHMANCYALLGHWGHLPFQEAFGRAKDAAIRAVELDATLSTAHWAFAWTTWVHDWDLAKCEEEILRAIQLNPSDEHAHELYSTFLATTQGDCAEAVREIQLALDLDPLSQYMNALAAWIYLFVRDYERAIEQARKTLELFPDSLQAYHVLGLAEGCGSRYARAIAALEKAVAISQDAISIAYLGSMHAGTGNGGQAQRLLKELLAKSEQEHVPPRCFVFLYAAMGELDRAFEWLEKSFAARDSGVFWLRAMPLYDPLRSDSRFEEMARRIGLTPKAG